MMVGLLVNLAVSYLFQWLFDSGRLETTHDLWNAVVRKRSVQSKYRKGDDSYISPDGIDNPALEHTTNL